MNHYPLGPPGHSGPDRPKGIPNKVTAAFDSLLDTYFRTKPIDRRCDAV